MWKWRATTQRPGSTERSVNHSKFPVIEFDWNGSSRDLHYNFAIFIAVERVRVDLGIIVIFVERFCEEVPSLILAIKSSFIILKATLKVKLAFKNSPIWIAWRLLKKYLPSQSGITKVMMMKSQEYSVCIDFTGLVQRLDLLVRSLEFSASPLVLQTIFSSFG